MLELNVFNYNVVIYNNYLTIYTIKYESNLNYNLWTFTNAYLTFKLHKLKNTSYT